MRWFEGRFHRNTAVHYYLLPNLRTIKFWLTRRPSTARGSLDEPELNGSAANLGAVSRLRYGIRSLYTESGTVLTCTECAVPLRHTAC